MARFGAGDDAHEAWPSPARGAAVAGRLRGESVPDWWFRGAGNAVCPVFGWSKGGENRFFFSVSSVNILLSVWWLTK